MRRLAILYPVFALAATDQDALWHWLHVALWDPPPVGPRPLEILQSPGVRIYAEGWGRPSDVGIVAVVDGDDAGACWMRLLPRGVGLASVDDSTPQLGSIPNRNYMNLLELPLLFYVVCLLLVVTSGASDLAVALAWAYVAMRVVHSLIHLTYNRVIHRLAAFALSNAALVALWLVAAVHIMSNAAV